MAGARTNVLLWAAVPWIFYGMPPTGPIVPSGLIVPVMAASYRTFSPRTADSTPTVIRPPALGPSIRPNTLELTS